jgi:hypothetical protein
VSIDTAAPNRLLTEIGAAPSNDGPDHTKTMRSGVDGAKEQSHPSTQHPTEATSMSISIGHMRKEVDYQHDTQAERMQQSANVQTPV